MIESCLNYIRNILSLDDQPIYRPVAYNQQLMFYIIVVYCTASICSGGKRTNKGSGCEAGILPGYPCEENCLMPAQTSESSTLHQHTHSQHCYQAKLINTMKLMLAWMVVIYR